MATDRYPFSTINEPSVATHWCCGGVNRHGCNNSAAVDVVSRFLCRYQNRLGVAVDHVGQPGCVARLARGRPSGNGRLRDRVTLLEAAVECLGEPRRRLVQDRP